MVDVRPKQSQPVFPWAFHDRALFSSELLTVSTEPWAATGREPAIWREPAYGRRQWHQYTSRSRFKKNWEVEGEFCEHIIRALNSETCAKAFTFLHSLSLFKLVWIVSVSYYGKSPNVISFNAWFKSLLFHEILSTQDSLKKMLALNP